jgi:hypothetical protein
VRTACKAGSANAFPAKEVSSQLLSILFNFVCTCNSLLIHHQYYIVNAAACRRVSLTDRPNAKKRVHCRGVITTQRALQYFGAAAGTEPTFACNLELPADKILVEASILMCLDLIVL